MAISIYFYYPIKHEVFLLLGLPCEKPEASGANPTQLYKKPSRADGASLKNGCQSLSDSARLPGPGSGKAQSF